MSAPSCRTAPAGQAGADLRKEDTALVRPVLNGVRASSAVQRNDLDV